MDLIDTPAFSCIVLLLSHVMVAGIMEIENVQAANFRPPKSE